MVYLAEVLFVLEVCCGKSHRLDGLAVLSTQLLVAAAGVQHATSLSRRHPRVRTVDVVKFRQIHLVTWRRGGHRHWRRGLRHSVYRPSHHQEPGEVLEEERPHGRRQEVRPRSAPAPVERDDGVDDAADVDDDSEQEVLGEERDTE